MGSIVEVRVKVMNDGGVDIYSSRSMVKACEKHGKGMVGAWYLRV